MSGSGNLAERILRAAGRGWAAVRRAIDVLLPCRFAILVLAAVAVALAAIDQGAESLRVMAEFGAPSQVGGNEPYLFRLGLFFVAAATLAASAWYFSRQAVLLQPPARPVSPVQEFLFRWAPRGLGLLGFGVPALALWLAADQYAVAVDVDQTPSPWLLLRLLAIAFLLSGVLFALLLARRRRLFRLEPLAVPDRGKRLRNLPKNAQRVIAASAVVTAALFVFILVDPIGLTAFVAVPTVLLFCAAIWVFTGTMVVLAAARWRLPLLSLLAVLLLVSSFWNDNHRVRPSAKARARPTLEEAAAAWVARLDALFPDEPRHPLFVVAAEGGGLRAAYWTAAVLSAIQAQYLTFAPHCFAISGVSGGSLGAAVFVGLDASGAADYRASARQILSHDFLAPTMARLLGSDLPQQFLPFPVLPDRGAAMEAAWERAWAKAGAGTFGRPFLELALEHRPLLFLNATDVATGKRIVFSGVQIRSRAGRAEDAALFKNAADGIDLLGGDLPISAAVHMSARFTYISPAGRVQSRDGVHRIVDGGYFENSGAATAAEIVAYLLSSRNPARERVAVHVLLVSHREKPLPAGEALSEELAPVRALLAARVARGEHAAAELKELAGRSGWTSFNLQTDAGVPLPLGWLLSSQARRAIDEAIDSRWNLRARARIGELLTGLAPTSARNLLPDAQSRKAAEKRKKPTGLRETLRRMVQAR